MDRRALVFSIVSVVSFVLYPLADRYDGAAGWSFVPIMLSVVYAVLAVASYLDHRTKRSLTPRPQGYDRHDGQG